MKITYFIAQGFSEDKMNSSSEASRCQGGYVGMQSRMARMLDGPNVRHIFKQAPALRLLI